MFLRCESGYRRHGEQKARGPFLMIFNYDPTGENKEQTRRLFGVVRHVSMSQCGQWMMGTARIGDRSVTVSGTYGAEGLPKDLDPFVEDSVHDDFIKKYLTELPPELVKKFWAGGGHNCAGSEGPAMRAWGLKLMKKSCNHKWKAMMGHAYVCEKCGARKARPSRLYMNTTRRR